MNRDGSKGAGVLMDRRRRSGDDSPRRASCGYWRKQTRVGSRVRGRRGGDARVCIPRTWRSGDGPGAQVQWSTPPAASRGCIASTPTRPATRSPPTRGTTGVTVKAGADPVPRYFFEFHADAYDAYGDARQGSGFRAGYGYEKGTRLISSDGHSLFTNSLIPLRAVLGGTAVEYADALIPTSSSSSTWGAVKQSL